MNIKEQIEVMRNGTGMDIFWYPQEKIADTLEKLYAVYEAAKGWTKHESRPEVAYDRLIKAIAAVESDDDV